MITNKDQKALQNKIFLILVIFSGRNGSLRRASVMAPGV